MTWNSRNDVALAPIQFAIAWSSVTAARTCREEAEPKVQTRNFGSNADGERQRESSSIRIARESYSSANKVKQERIDAPFRYIVTRAPNAAPGRPSERARGKGRRLCIIFEVNLILTNLPSDN